MNKIIGVINAYIFVRIRNNSFHKVTVYCKKGYKDNLDELTRFIAMKICFIAWLGC